MAKSLAIIGAGGHGSVVADAAALTGEWTSIVFYDDKKTVGSRHGVWQINGPVEQLLNQADGPYECVVAVGDNVARLSAAERVQCRGLRLVNVIHPKAMVSPHCQIGCGSVVFAGAVVNIGSELGQACIINNAATVNHDCVLASGVHVGPNAALGGNVTVGQASWIGIGASIRHGIHIGDGVVVGAGAAVVSDIGNNETTVGVPARSVLPRS